MTSNKFYNSKIHNIFVKKRNAKNFAKKPEILKIKEKLWRKLIIKDKKDSFNSNGLRKNIFPEISFRFPIFRETFRWLETLFVGRF